MKSYKIFVVLCAVLLMANFLSAQHIQQRKNITKNYDLKKINHLSNQLSQKFQEERKSALDYAIANDLPLVVEKENGEKSYLFRMDEKGNLLYVKADGKADAKTIGTDKLYPQGGLGLSLEGEGMKAGVWDAGAVRATHELLDGKVTQQDGGEGESPNHATHVAGIVAGKELSGGIGESAKGMAYKADIDAYDWFDDLAEMYNAAADGLLVSNHSYGIDLSQVGDYHSVLGKYDEVSDAVDELMNSAPYYTLVTSAGNDRNSGYNTAQGGYNLLGGWMTTAKNPIVVAAVEKILMYLGPSNVVMSSFSSWGPTVDNRVKPDISAQGVEVLSSTANSNDSYDYYDGTSMAAPGVAGSLLLLQELSADLNQGEFLRSSTLKAIIIATALEAGENPGPDPKFGWGLLSTDAAAQLMLDSHEGSNAFYQELKLEEENNSYSIKVKANEEEELKATIAWTDVSGSELINDLDLRITDSQGNTFYPWRLDPVDIASPALNDADNNVDNVEKVWVENAVEGEEYTITVTYKDELESGEQEFGLAVTGVQEVPLSNENQELAEVVIYPNPASDLLNINTENSTEEIHFSIFDLQGRKVFEKRNNSSTKTNFQVDISALNSGIYFLKINVGNKTTTEKITIK